MPHDCSGAPGVGWDHSQHQTISSSLLPDTGRLQCLQPDWVFLVQKWMGDVSNRSDSVRTSCVAVFVSINKPEGQDGTQLSYTSKDMAHVSPAVVCGNLCG